MPCTMNAVRFHEDLTVANRRRNNVNSLSSSRNHFHIPSFPSESFLSFFIYSQIDRSVNRSSDDVDSITGVSRIFYRINLIDEIELVNFKSTKFNRNKFIISHNINL